jgi:hypothetical protein
VRVVTRVQGEEVVVGGGKYDRIATVRTIPRIVVSYPAGNKEFDAVTGQDDTGDWRIHPTDLMTVHQILPDDVRVVRSRWVEEHAGYRTLVGMRLARLRTLDADGSGARVLVVGLTPTVEVHERESRLLGRLLGFAQRDGWAQVEVVSLFSLLLAEHEPASVLGAIDPVGPDNDQTIASAAGRADLVIAGWGTVTLGRRRANLVRQRDDRVIALLREAGHAVIHAFVSGELASESHITSSYPPHPTCVSPASVLRPWTKSERIRTRGPT